MSPIRVSAPSAILWNMRVEGILVMRAALSFTNRPGRPSPSKNGSFCSLYELALICPMTR
eukprot:scaffold358061_cov41-Attheya_sp.AAC.2